jgi:hypothetical protein
MPSSFKAADIKTSHKSPRPARRHPHAGSSAAPSAARLAAEAAFFDTPAQRGAVQPLPVNTARDEARVPTPVAAPVSAASSVETATGAREPRVFRVSRVAPATSGCDAPWADVAGPDGSGRTAGVGTSDREIEAASAPRVRPTIPRRRPGHAAMSGPVTVLSAPAALAVAVAAAPSDDEAHVSGAPATLAELLERLAALTATLEELRRMPARDFQARPNAGAWARWSRKAEDLLDDIRSARRR